MKSILHIVKIGGNVAEDTVQLEAVLHDFAALEGHKILVHGGGKTTSEMCRKLGIPVQMVDGRRITDAATLEVAVMVYAGLTNKRIVALLQSMNCNALGLSGADGNSILAHKRTGAAIDYGFAGDVDKVNGAFFTQLLEAGLTPVCCAITHDQHGQLLNTNADTIANEVATALARSYEVWLHYCFEKPGVLLDPDHDESVITGINQEQYEEFKTTGVVSGGMIPKLDNAFAALRAGVHTVRIGGPVMLQPNMVCTTLSLF